MLWSTWAEKGPHLLKVGGLPCASIAPHSSWSTASPTGHDPESHCRKVQLPTLLLCHPSISYMEENVSGNGEADGSFSHLYCHSWVHPTVFSHPQKCLTLPVKNPFQQMTATWTMIFGHVQQEAKGMITVVFGLIPLTSRACSNCSRLLCLTK